MVRNLFIILLAILSLQANAKDFLFKDGKSDYSIVIPTTASQSEQTAAKELQSYIKQVSGVTLTTSTTVPKTGHFIYIGYRSTIAKVKPKATDESYTYKTNDGNLYIWGGRDRGTMYGVFSFLENELGVRWYTSDFTKVPKLTEYAMPTLNHTETPCIKQRLDFYYTPLVDAKWCAHNKLNEQYNVTKNEYGNTTAIYGIHTLFNLVPPETYFQTHPEYYSLRNGERQHKTGQLCLSNPEVLAIAKKSIIQTIKEHPDYWVYDVSQMDNQNYCQCDKCTALAERYGGQSGLMIWFVNQVADEVRKVYPTKKVSTLAYRFTRHAPIGIKPRSNVVVRLCDIECCFRHPLSSEKCEKNKSFMDDLVAWGKLSKNIYVWDYVVNFTNYLVPLPNFSVLKSNIKTLSKNGAVGILEEGAHNARWGEFSELRTWVLAKLLWKPDQDVDNLVTEFIYDYYGEASNDVYAYFKLAQTWKAEDHMSYKDHSEKDHFDDEFLDAANVIMNQASQKVKGDLVKEKRVNRVLAQIYYIYCCRNLFKAKQDGTYKKLKEILKQDPTIIMEEGEDLDLYLKKQGYT